MTLGKFCPIKTEIKNYLEKNYLESLIILVVNNFYNYFIIQEEEKKKTGKPTFKHLIVKIIAKKELNETQ